MSEVLARIRVCEISGIRRFLYPLSATIALTPTVKSGQLKTLSEMYRDFSLQDANGQAIPVQLTGLGKIPDTRLDFALFLAPGETQDLSVVSGSSVETLPDPLQVAPTHEGGLKNTQTRFTVGISPEGNISEVSYDGVRHLRGPSRILRNGKAAWHSSNSAWRDAYFSLYSQMQAKSRYSDEVFAQTRAELTACKSWVTLTHTVDQTAPGDEIIFALPFAVTSPVLTCDFGVGGSVFGKMDVQAPEIFWRTEFGEVVHAKWAIATAGRVDYRGEVEGAEAFQSQRWFHLIDSDKALAAAITKVPAGCREMTVRLTREGDVLVAFTLGDRAAGPAEFGICWHFLNGIPAIAAATNPQSILLPPLVEVLPV